MRYSAKKISASVYHIISERRKVGFISQCPKGFVARIGQHCEVRATVREAFNAVTLKAMEFASEAALAAHNAGVRERNAALRSEAYAAGQAMRAGNFDPLFDLLKKV